VVLLADQVDGGPGMSDPEVCKVVGCSRATVERVRKQFAKEGLKAVLQPKTSRRAYQRKLDRATAAQLIAVAFSPPPWWQERWTLRLLSDKMVELGHVDSVSYETVRRTLKESNIRLW
jgi:transposase